MIKQVKIKDKTKLLLELNLLTPQLKELSKKVHDIQKQIELIESKERRRGLIITDHAFDRFKERIGCYNNDTIRNMLITQDLINKYISCNQGDIRISHPNIDNCDCVISDGRIVTIINTYDPYRELDRLSLYMKYYVNTLCKFEKPLSFIKWQQNNIKGISKKKNK